MQDFHLTENKHKNEKVFSFDFSVDEFIDNKVFDVQSAFSKNKRKTVRYVRRDITAFVNQADIFGTFSLFSESRTVRVRLLDISSKGGMIASSDRFKANRKLLLTLIFDNNKKFEIPVRIVREIIRKKNFYGLKFEKTNEELAEHLMSSESTWSFR